MLRSRIIPCLLVHKKGLIKSTKFKDYKYVGDPINAVKIFNEKQVDELIVIDIDASKEKRGPDFEMIKNLAVECRMPFCYGGGISTVEQAKKIVNLGAEKIAISSSALKNTSLLREIGQAIGVQSVVVVIDVKKKSSLFGSSYEMYTINGTLKSDRKLDDFLREINSIGIGELVLNAIDRDGTELGYDIALIEHVRNIIDVPMTVMGGASSYQNIQELIQKFKIIGAAAGSLFVFKGKYKAVLISYPSKEEKWKIVHNS